MANSIYQTLGFLLITLLVGCSAPKSLEENETLLKVFSQSEATGLQEIHDYFSDQICEMTGESDPASCFENFMSGIKEESPKSGALPDLHDKKEQDDFFASIDKELFDQIWDKNDFMDASGIKKSNLELKNQGKYTDFLLEFGKEDPSIAKYHDMLLGAGFISASMVADVMMFPEKYDVNNVCVRLVIAIHYLTVCYVP